MKIHGLKQTNFNPYANQLRNQSAVQKGMSGKDRLEISEQAKQMQESDKPEAERKAYVQNIKHAVESGKYQINVEKTAEKMLAFWSNRS
ncbi:MAG TPA: flagellar biosynthesis anti-sigma factor FlgM [Bacillota bacterium]|nr:flagellar biosynthesis anti-sigma factor FlgM [Bacillota bacterium]